jgi:GT2 family glycosyltransferase
MAIDLNIIIVNYKTPRLLNDCLASIYSQPWQINFQVIVVDNASKDDSREIIMASFPAVRWIQMEYNAGFARANNEGMRQSAAAVVLLLNSDTIIENNAIEDCYKAFVNSGYVGCGVQLLNPDGSPQISGNFFMRGGLNFLLILPYIGGFVKRLGNLIKVKKPNVPVAQTLVEVDWINGAFLMVKKEAIKKAGLMDEDFFLYAEETEWCSRLRKTGELCIYGQLHVTHLQGATANEVFGSSGKGYYNLYDRKGLQFMVSNFLRIRKQYGTGWFLFHLLIYSIGVPVYFTGSLIEHIFRLRNPFSEFPRAAKLAVHVVKIWGIAPRIIANKPYFYKVL